MPRRKRLKKNPFKNEYEAREVALGLLARREHSKRELVLKLRARSCPDKIIYQVVDALAAEGMQSDARFAETFVRNRIDRGAGPLRVRAEMLTRGLDDETIETALAEYKEWWKDLAVEVYQKRYGDADQPTEFAEKAKRMNFLQSRGFTTEQIQYALSFKSDTTDQ